MAPDTARRSWIAAAIVSVLILLAATTKTDWITQMKNKPVADTREYDFSPLSPGGSLSAGSNTVTVRPVPFGMNGTNSNYYVYVSGGTGTAESCLVTGGTAVSGAASGTLIMTCSNSHTGAWTISSATAGIVESIYATATGGRYAIHKPAGSSTIRSMVYLPPGVASRVELDSDLTFDSSVGSNDGFWIDSCKACRIIVGGNVGYKGTGYAVRLNPKNPTPDDNIKQIQWSTIRFANVQSYPNGGDPGSGVPVAQANIRVLLEGDVASPVQGLVSHNKLEFLSLWGALRGLVVDSAATTYPGWFEENIIHIQQLVYFTQQGARSCVASGTSVVCSNNIWNVSVVYGRDDGTGTAPQAGWSTGNNTAGGIWDIASFSQPAGKNSLTFGAGTSNVSIRAGSFSGTLVDSSGNFTNSVFLNGLQTYPSAGYATQSAGTSPYVCQNKQYVPMNVLVSGGTVSSIGLSVDGSSYINSGTSGYYMVWPGMYLKISHTGAPSMFLWCQGKAVCACN